MADALKEYAQVIDERLHSVDDPAERLAGVCGSARVADSYPKFMQILCHSLPGRICRGGGLVPRAKRDVEEGVAAGRFSVVDPVIALTAPNGSLLALLKLWCNQPEADSGQAAGARAEMVLDMLGLFPNEARDLARRHPPAAA
ncbi:TetR/AcrR family transcriptional regulator [Streptomyces sp. NPDC051453]|uniref:TetR/AcrR family transcriptional regulator n=1 Tax=Streptomyces sp. NPDC051453 TaxID=3154941 RepID=UPI00342F04BE